MSGSDDSDDIDPVVRAYMDGVDVTLLRENLRLTVEQRLDQLMDMQRSLEDLHEIGRRAGLIVAAEPRER